MADRAGGRSAWEGASGCRAMRAVGGGGAGGDNSKGWSGESRISNATSDAELEGGEEEHAPLTASPWGTQEIGARRLRVGARSGGSGGGKVTSGTADGRETRSRHGAKKQHGGEKGGRRGWECEDPWGVGGDSGGRKASAVGPDPHGVEWEEGGREASGVEKNPSFHSMADPPGVFLHSVGLSPPLLPLHSVGIGAHCGGLAAPIEDG